MATSLLLLRPAIKGVLMTPTTLRPVLRRTLLSAAYACDDAWQAQRTQCESLKHISPSRYFFELNNKYQQRKPVSAVDVDIYLNSLHRAENVDELEHIVRRLRASRQTVNTLESSSHAVCRFYLRHGKRDALLAILSDRVKYGIFADHFIANIVLDGALKAADYEAAFTMVQLMALQEDPGNEVTKTLALHTLLHLIDTDAVVDKKGEEEGAAAASGEEPPAEEEVDEEEIEYIRVPYLTNAYFDDHFDLSNRAHLFGKSLYFFGLHVDSDSSTESDRLLGATAQILGLLYYEKWEKLRRLLLQGRLKGRTISGEALEVALKQLKHQHQTEEAKSVISLVQALPKKTTTSGASLSSLMAERIAALPVQEAADMSAQKALFARFEADRLESITGQLNRLLSEQAAAELEGKKRELEEKRRLYYFFENFPQHEINFVEAERRIAELQASTVIDEDYVPPEI